MNQHFSDAYENQKKIPEKIELVGREMPTLQSIYEQLSTAPDIKVFSKAEYIYDGDERRVISEKEMIDDLLEFGALAQNVLKGQMHDEDREVLEHIDGFIDSIHFLSHEAYDEAIQGIAVHHAEWLEQDDNRRVQFVVQSSRKVRSQWKIASDIASKVSSDVADRVSVATLEDVSEGQAYDGDVKFVLADDWSVSGNLLAEDASRAYRVFDSIGIDAPVEIDLLVARQDQITEGIHSIVRYVNETALDHVNPDILAYFQAPSVKSVYGYEALPSGSHSSVDYGFSETLSRMYKVLERYIPVDQEVHVPYIAKIIPKYGYNYDD